jgi:hypothetical protein
MTHNAVGRLIPEEQAKQLLEGVEADLSATRLTDIEER